MHNKKKYSYLLIGIVSIALLMAIFYPRNAYKEKVNK